MTLFSIRIERKPVRNLRGVSELVLCSKSQPADRYFIHSHPTAKQRGLHSQ